MFRFSSPALEPDDRVLKECPVGAVLRESPHVYDAMSIAHYADKGGVNPLQTTSWLGSALRVISSERVRMEEMSAKDKASAGDSAAAGRALRRG